MVDEIDYELELEKGRGQLVATLQSLLDRVKNNEIQSIAFVACHGDTITSFWSGFVNDPRLLTYGVASLEFRLHQKLLDGNRSGL